MMTDKVEIQSIKIADYNYPLPDGRIARHPLQDRASCKLLVRTPDGHLSDRRFDELPGLLPDGAMLVYNNTRVINARLRFRKSSGALIEVFCLEPESPADYAQSFASTGHCSWRCFVGNSKRWKEGALEMPVMAGGIDVVLRATRLTKDDGGSVIAFDWDNSAVSFSSIIEAAGEMPIPPYLNRRSEASDVVDYQTVFSRIEGSVAAPTAGLHFTPEVLDAIDKRGVLRREVTLHVGAGTFQPVKSDTIGEHPMHSEFLSVERSLIEELMRWDGRVIAVGTTSVRTLESLYHLGCMCAAGMPVDEVPQWYPYAAEHPGLSVGESMKALLCHLDSTGQPCLVASTRLMIAPGYRFRIVGGMVTNFHQPQSTLLLLVSAFTGGDWRQMYNYALASDYRFLSYGDAQLLL